MKLYKSAMQQQIKLETRQTITKFYSYQINLICNNEKTLFFCSRHIWRAFDSIELVWFELLNDLLFAECFSKAQSNNSIRTRMKSFAILVPFTLLKILYEVSLRLNKPNFKWKSLMGLFFLNRINGSVFYKNVHII